MKKGKWKFSVKSAVASAIEYYFAALSCDHISFLRLEFQTALKIIYIVSTKKL